jgi:predicted dehydrogenase
VPDADTKNGSRPATEGVSHLSGGSPQNVASPTVSDATPHRRIFEDFIRAIQTDTTPACDGREGRRSVEVVDAIYASARARQPVTIG